MSKSIYEEALEDLSILVKQANERKLSNDIVVNRWSLERIEKVINQAQKQEKLLELYKELSVKERKRATSLKTKNVDKYNQLNKEIEIINDQIKELENDK